MALWQRHLASLAVLLLLFAPASGLCSQRGPAGTAEGACPMSGADTPCCCNEGCHEPADAQPEQSPDECPQMQRSDERLAPLPRAGVAYQPVLSPLVYTLPGSFEPESVRQGRLAAFVDYRPMIPPEAKSSLLAQRCALNT
jgi:hypothetical protein